MQFFIIVVAIKYSMFWDARAFNVCSGVTEVFFFFCIGLELFAFFVYVLPSFTLPFRPFRDTTPFLNFGRFMDKSLSNIEISERNLRFV